MPYRHAHYVLLALFPLIVLSFWPGYFGHLATARPAQHAHGMAATAWLALLTVQTWSAHARRLAWHRAAGLATFAVVPAFAAAGLLGVRDMAIEMNAGSPFEAYAAPALAPDDLSAVVALVAFVAAALATRRRVRRHAAWMLATAVLVLPPVTARLLQVVPRLVGFASPSFWWSSVLAQSLSIALALLLARGRGADGRPFLWLPPLFLAHIAMFAPCRDSAVWRATLAAFAGSPPLADALMAAALALVALVVGWRRVPARPRPVVARSSAMTA